MNNRLQQFLLAENITQAEFADRIQVARASVSHVLAGRNKPSYDFISGVMLNYPNLNLEWLLAGKGKMYRSENPKIESKPVQMPVPADSGLFSDTYEEPIITAPAIPEPVFEPKSSVQETVAENSRTPKISKVIVFYEDGSYVELKK